MRNEGGSSKGHAIVCDNLKKVYPGRDGNPPKMAVRGLYLDVTCGECFGMLGPNGAGKTSFISMVSFAKPPFIGLVCFANKHVFRMSDFVILYCILFFCCDR